MAIPSSLVQSLQSVKGFNQETFEAVHASGEQVTSIRLNPAKLSSINELDFPGDISFTKIPWSTAGYYLNTRPSFTADPLLHAGAYYVQEASSMFLEEVLRQTVDLSVELKVLDLCAAPGGKSALIQSLLNDQSLLISNELIKTRVNILTENLSKWGTANVIVTNNDAASFKRLPGYFDVVVVDAPCSGSGLFRKDENAIKEWSDQNVVLCSQRQQRILEDVMPSLKPGGILIYSTCSYSEAEDEHIAAWLVNDLHMQALQIKIADSWQIVETIPLLNNGYGYRFFPDRLKGEGFYVAAFKKNNEVGEEERGKKHDQKRAGKLTKLSPAALKSIARYLHNSNSYFYLLQNGELLALPFFLEKELPYIQSALYLKKAGISIGTLIRDELVPGHELAMSGQLAPNIIRVEVSKENALQYLRRQEITGQIPGTGWAIITHRSLPLGWVKLLQNRVNNYYPKEWRILNK